MGLDTEEYNVAIENTVVKDLQNFCKASLELYSPPELGNRRQEGIKRY